MRYDDIMKLAAELSFFSALRLLSDRAEPRDGNVYVLLHHS